VRDGRRASHGRGIARSGGGARAPCDDGLRRLCRDGRGLLREGDDGRRQERERADEVDKAAGEDRGDETDPVPERATDEGADGEGAEPDRPQRGVDAALEVGRDDRLPQAERVDVPGGQREPEYQPPGGDREGGRAEQAERDQEVGAPPPAGSTARASGRPRAPDWPASRPAPPGRSPRCRTPAPRRRGPA